MRYVHQDIRDNIFSHRLVAHSIHDYWKPRGSIANELPSNVIVHLPQARLILDSAKSCQLCALIRDAIVVDHYVDTQSRIPPGYLVDWLPSDLIQSQSYAHELFQSSPYADSPVYLRLSMYRPYIIPERVIGYIVVLLAPNTSTGDASLLSGYISAQAHPGTAAQRSGVVTTRPLPSRENVQNITLQLEQWTLNCFANHEDCRITMMERKLINESADLPLLPTRVVEVLDEENIRLVETGGKMNAKWIALSHCWGDPSNHPPKTTKNTLAKWMGGVSRNELPRTFRDAISLADSLGIRYVWIDSLCIIQDDREDWLRESPKMGAIYENAYLTFAATGATDSTVGLFDPEHYNDYHLQQVKVPFYDLKDCRDGSSGMQSDGAFSVGIDWRHPLWNRDPDLAGYPLAKRGWITQEWMLSRRTVHFLRGTLLWVCRRGTVHENGFGIYDEEYDRSTYNAQNFTWRDLIVGHSARQVTKLEDKLLSLEGLVTEMKKARDDTYQYGMWDRSFRDDILWVPNGVEQDQSHSHVPSWSWAYREGEMMYGRWNLPGESRLMSYCDVFQGIGKDGVMRICSRLKLAGSVKFSPVIDDNEDFFSDFGLAKRLSSHGIHLLMDGTGDEFGWACLDGGNFEESDFQDIFLLLLGTAYGIPDRRDLAWGNDRYMSQFCMLLRRATESDIFKRVGIAKVKNVSWFDGEEKQEVRIR